MGWIQWQGVRALIVDAAANLLLGSPDCASIIVPNDRPIKSKIGAWIAYHRTSNNELLYAYNVTARFNESGGATFFSRDVVVQGTLHAPGLPVALARGPLEGAAYYSRGITAWTPAGTGQLNFAWSPAISAPIILITGEAGGHQIFRAAAIGGSSASILCTNAETFAPSPGGVCSVVVFGG